MNARTLALAARERRAMLRTRLAGRPALLPAGRPRPRNYPHNHYPFRASSHFLYFMGLGVPEAALWLDGDDQRLLLAPTDPLDVLWPGPGHDPARLAAETGLRLGALEELPALAGGRSVATVPLLAAEDRDARIAGENCYGPAKLRMIAEWVDKSGLKGVHGHVRFYSDHASDAPVFEWCDEPVAVNPHGRLRRLAKQRGWAIEDWG